MMMRTLMAGLAIGSLSLISGAGCGGSVKEGMPAETKYVPPMEQPSMGGAKGNPVANAKKAQAEAAKAAKAADAAPKP